MQTRVVRVPFVPGIFGVANNWSTTIPRGVELVPVEWRSSGPSGADASGTQGCEFGGAGDATEVSALRLLHVALNLSAGGGPWALACHSAGGQVVYRCLDLLVDLAQDPRAARTIANSSLAWLPEEEGHELAKALEGIKPDKSDKADNADVAPPFRLPVAVLSFEGTLMPCDVEGWAADFAARPEPPPDESWIPKAMADSSSQWTWPLARACAGSMWQRCGQEVPARHLASIRRWLLLPNSPGLVYVAGKGSAKRNQVVFPALRQLAESCGRSNKLLLEEVENAGHNLHREAPSSVRALFTKVLLGAAPSDSFSCGSAVPPASSCMIPIFVYGTLKRGFFNYHKVLCDTCSGGAAQFVGEAITEKKHALIIVSRYRVPFAFDVPEGMAGHQLKGELFLVNQKMLEQLDELEGHPHYYNRGDRQVVVEGETRPAMIYLLPSQHFNAGVVPHFECISEYTLDHHEEYVPPIARPPTSRTEIHENIKQPQRHDGQSTKRKTAESNGSNWTDFAVVVVDAQRDFALKETPTLVRIAELLKFARTECIDVLHVRSKRCSNKSNWPPCYVIRGKPPRCIEHTEGARVCPEAAATLEEPIFFKGGFDIWAGQDASKFESALDGKHHILVCGFVTSVCVLQCALGAVNRGILATVIEDCCTDDAPTDAATILKRYAWTLGTCGLDDVAKRLPEWREEMGSLREVKRQRIVNS